MKNIFYILVCCFSSIFFGNAQEASQILSDFIKIPSISGNEKKAAKFLEKICKDKGLSIRVFSKTDSTYSFAASLYPLTDNKQNIIFLNHLDVVSVDDKNDWLYPPYSGKIVDDTLWGRGALDMKGIAVMQLMAILKFKEDPAYKNFKYNITLLCLSGEESGGKNGAKIVCDNYLNDLKPLVVFGEGGAGLTNVIPGNAGKKVFFVSVAEKQSVWIKLEAKERSHAHASLPSDKSANRIMLRAIDKVENHDPKIKFDRTSKRTFKKLGKLVPGYKGFVLGHIYWGILKPIRKKVLAQNELMLPMVQNTFQLTSIQNPQGAFNQISGVSTAYFDCRLLPRIDAKPFTLKRLMRVLDPRIKLTVLDESPEAEPTQPDKFFDFFSNAIKVIHPSAEVIPFLFLASSDNSYFRNKGIPTYGLMPLELNAALMQTVHGKNERIPLIGLKKGIQTYYIFLKNVFELDK